MGKKKKIYGMEVRLVGDRAAEPARNNFLSIDSITGVVSIRAKKWKLLPRQVKFWMLKWAHYRFNGGIPLYTAYADEKASLDYMKRKYPGRMLLEWITKALSGQPTPENARRIEKVKKLLKLKPKFKRT